MSIKNLALCSFFVFFSTGVYADPYTGQKGVESYDFELKFVQKRKYIVREYLEKNEIQLSKDSYVHSVDYSRVEEIALSWLNFAAEGNQKKLKKMLNKGEEVRFESLDKKEAQMFWGNAKYAEKVLFDQRVDYGTENAEGKFSVVTFLIKKAESKEFEFFKVFLIWGGHRWQIFFPSYDHFIFSMK